MGTLQTAKCANIGLVFPGQGSQSVGMGREWVEADPSIQKLYDEATSILNYDIAALCFDGPAEQLNLTEYTQPALLVSSMVALHAFQALGIMPIVVAGHSLGEYSALVAAGGLSYREAVAIVQKRGRYMAEAVPLGTGLVVVLLGLTGEVVQEVCHVEIKYQILRMSLPQYLILSALAGVYVGFGIALIFSLGGPLAVAGSPFLKLVMGVSFGVALTLVIFAGAELFTGNNMTGVIGGLSRHLTWPQVGQINFWSWVGNLIGSLILAWLVIESGVMSKGSSAELIAKVAAMKMSLPPWELFVRGILCNWVICLAIWTAARTTDAVAKLILIFWCLFIFISVGFEHSIANQSLLGMALFLPHDASISWVGFWYNQFFVVAGNIVGGGFFVGGLYWLASPYTTKSSAENAI